MAGPITVKYPQTIIVLAELAQRDSLPVSYRLHGDDTHHRDHTVASVHPHEKTISFNLPDGTFCCTHPISHITHFSA